MRTVIVYESMYGNTHAVAEQIADAARQHGEASLVPVGDATPETLRDADLVIVGGPTHAHGMTRPTTRKAAVDDAAKQDDLDPDAEGPGLRDWFEGAAHVDGTAAAAFDTRFDASPVLTGRASKGISKRLRHHGYHEIADPESFLVNKQTHLLDGEADRAHAWAESLLSRLSTVD